MTVAGCTTGTLRLRPSRASATTGVTRRPSFSTSTKTPTTSTSSFRPSSINSGQPNCSGFSCTLNYPFEAFKCRTIPCYEGSDVLSEFVSNFLGGPADRQKDKGKNVTFLADVATNTQNKHTKFNVSLNEDLISSLFGPVQAPWL